MGFFNKNQWAGKRTTLTQFSAQLPKCGVCGLYKHCTTPKMPPSVGDGKRKILFIGDAPTANDDRHGEHFTGTAGQCLRSMLAEIDVDLDDCAQTYAVICHPNDTKLLPLHVDSCRPNAINTVRQLKPNVIVPMGHRAVRAVIGADWGGDMGEMETWVGWNIPSQSFGAWICPIYDPAYIVAMKDDPPLVIRTTEHLRRAVLLERQPVPTDAYAAISGAITIEPAPRHARTLLRALALQSGVLAFDYETTGLKPERPEQKIYSVSWCVDGRPAVACRIDQTCFGELSAVLKNPNLKKVASNLKFEERWTLRKLGHGVVGWHWDTMLAAHVLNNAPNITSVKFQNYVMLGIGDYDSTVKPYLSSADDSANGLNQIHECPIGDLLTYNAMDSAVEFAVYKKQWSQFYGMPKRTDAERRGAPAHV